MRTRPDVPDHDENLILARVALLALRESVEAALPMVKYYVVEDRRFDLLEDASALLASMEKPVTCRLALHGARGQLTCRRQDQRGYRRIKSFDFEALTGVMRSVNRLLRRRGDRRQGVLVAVGEDPLVLSVGQFDGWEADYHLPDVSYSVDFIDPRSPDGTTSDAEYVVRFSPPALARPQTDSRRL